MCGRKKSAVEIFFFCEEGSKTTSLSPNLLSCLRLLRVGESVDEIAVFYR